MLTPVEERRFRAIETVLKLGGVSNAEELVSEAKIIEAYVRANLSPDDGAVEPSPDDN